MTYKFTGALAVPNALAFRLVMTADRCSVKWLTFPLRHITGALSVNTLLQRSIGYMIAVVVHSCLMGST